MSPFRWPSPSSAVVLTLLAFSRVVVVVVAQNITISTCASPDTFRSCFADVTGDFNRCYADVKTVEEGAACECVQNIGLINCAYESCWNVAYGCEMQNILKSYVWYCEVPRQLPYFPAPDNAPGGCSCNVGQVALDIIGTFNSYTNCVAQAGISLDALAGCSCCEQATAYTAIYDVCPNVNPAYLIFPTLPTLLSVADPQLAFCGPSFSRYNCNADLGFSSISDNTYRTAFPASTGTGTYSATGTLTAPVSPTVTWTALGVVTTITAVGTGRSNNSDNNGNNNGNGNDNGNGNPAGTQPASPTKTGGAGRQVTLKSASVSMYITAMVVGFTALQVW